MNIGQRIAQARGFNRLTQGQLADALSVTVQTVSNWERVRRMPDADSIRQLCVIMHISADWLLGLSDEAGLK